MSELLTVHTPAATVESVNTTFPCRHVQFTKDFPVFGVAVTLKACVLESIICVGDTVPPVPAIAMSVSRCALFMVTESIVVVS